MIIKKCTCSYPRTDYDLPLCPIHGYINEKKEEIEKPEWIKELNVLEIKEGDIIIIKTTDYLTSSQIEFIRQEFAKHVSNQVLILEGGLEIGAIRKKNGG